MGLVRLSTAQIWVFGIFWVQTLKLSSEMIKNRKTRLIFHVFFRYFCSTVCRTYAIQNHFFPVLKNTAMFQFMLLGVVLGKKTSNDFRLTVITLNVVRHVPRALVPFL